MDFKFCLNRERRGEERNNAVMLSTPGELEALVSSEPAAPASPTEVSRAGEIMMSVRVKIYQYLH